METLKDIVLKFKVENEITEVKPLGEGLINDIKGWLEVLEEGYTSATEFVEACKAKEEKFRIISDGERKEENPQSKVYCASI